MSNLPYETDHPARSAATKPREVPLAGWKAAVRGSLHALKEHEAVAVAASVTFFALLGLFPAIVAFASMYGLLTSPEEAQAQLSGLGEAVPGRVHEILMAQAQSATLRSTGLWSLLASVSLSLLGASNATVQVMKAVSIAYDQPDERSFVRRRGVALLLTAGFAVACGIALATIAVLPILAEWLSLDRTSKLLLDYGRWPVLAVLMVGGLSALYALAPHRRPPRWRWLTWGSAVATILWLGVSIGFAWFAEQFGIFAEIYGALAGAIVLMLWLWLSALVIMVGAELNAHLEQQTTADIRREQPLRAKLRRR